jgi:hypothetical protein
MKTLVFGVTAHLGIDCCFCSHDEFETFEVELEDADAAKIEAAAKGKESLSQEEIEALCPEAAETIDAAAYATLLDMCVVNGWDEYGSDACSEDLSELFEEDLESGAFSFTPEDAEEMEEDELYDEQYDAWQEAEEAKMDAMSLHEKSQYLQNRYGLDCDVADTGYDYEYLNQ